MKIGFIGQGWIGKNYANDFEKRGLSVIRYSLEKEYVQNKDLIRGCDIVFIAVPTPSTVNGFDSSFVEDALRCLKEGSVAVIKSTVLPGTTNKLQNLFPNIFVLHSPEFLREAHAEIDATSPKRNIIGIPIDNDVYKQKAKEVLSTLPKAPFEKIMLATEAELVKYIGNCFFYEKVVFFNQMFDLVQSLGQDYEAIIDAVVHDERIGSSHTKVVHASGHNQEKAGRGAGGHCFIKDFEALIEIYKKQLPKDALGIEVLTNIRDKNYNLLVSSNKDIDLLEKVIGRIPSYKK